MNNISPNPGSRSYTLFVYSIFNYLTTIENPPGQSCVDSQTKSYLLLKQIMKADKARLPALFQLFLLRAAVMNAVRSHAGIPSTIKNLITESVMGSTVSSNLKDYPTVTEELRNQFQSIPSGIQTYILKAVLSKLVATTFSNKEGARKDKTQPYVAALARIILPLLKSIYNGQSKMAVVMDTTALVERELTGLVGNQLGNYTQAWVGGWVQAHKEKAFLGDIAVVIAAILSRSSAKSMIKNLSKDNLLWHGLPQQILLEVQLAILSELIKASIKK